MGQTPSKRASNASSITLLTTTSSPNSPNTPSSPPTPSSPISEITQPSVPRQLHRISEIIDPRTLLLHEDPFNTPTRINRSSTLSPSTPGIVHSPSGNVLGAHEFIAHPDRPLAMWERQERVLQATREGVERFEAASRTGMRAESLRGEGIGDVEKRKPRWRCYFCCCC